MDWFAGVHTPARGERAARAVGRLAEERGVSSFAQGPVTVAGEPISPRCAVAGALHGVGELARALGLDPGTDPEIVLLAGFRRHGEHVLERLRGPFALFLWDAETGRGLVGQDPMALGGVFVTETPHGMAFATEVRELLELLPARPAPDAVAVSHVAAGSAAPPGRTLFAGVRRLAGGTCVLLDRERARVVEHWAPRYEGTLRLSEEERAERLREQLGVAVDRAVGGEPTAGVLLSGGLDSSMVACMAAARGIEVRGYSAVFPQHPDLDESAYVESVSSRWGIPITTDPVAPHGGFLAALEYLDAFKLPVLGIGYLLERGLVRRMADDGPMAVIDGQGGDELFAGSAFLPPHLVRRGRLAASLRILRSTPSTADIDSRDALLEMWKRMALKPAFPLPLIEARRRRRGPPPTPPWLVPAARALYAEAVDEWTWRRGIRGPLWWRWLADLLLRGPAESGRADYVRHRTSLGGLRGSSPLLDFDLARLVLRMPPHLAFDASIDRPLARRAMRGVLPEKVRLRTEKSNLFAFYRDVLAGPDLRWIRRILREPGCSVWEYVERSRMEPLLDGVPPAGDAASDMLLGALHNTAMLECWLRQQQDGASVPRLLDEVAV